ncbi:DUF3618 domain-containing protein [Mycobacterium sp. MYCO198283]|uniref:DUF3618 domain-containing protein n=1 Tax=Mycobacterium sp. MYCO198283 TaxID=2883505 RepID=UPI001E493CB8|nr:DUF3618 domain-containing protein [Mycobacterium sp. MYCO198283]MCG5434423.1 DUF3618 domain-containing protein [Mycobacterium sp. MYCO198283]
MTGPDGAHSEPGPDADVDAIQADIENTRAELGQTVEALSAKLDVKGQAQAKVDEKKQQVADKAQAVSHRAKQQPAVPAAAVVAVAALVIGLVVYRRRRR